MASVTPIGLAALKAREGVRLTAYLDSVGVWTIGWGHTKGVTKGQTITRGEAEAFLAADIDTHAAPILSAVKVPIADHESDALVSIAFNIGVGGFRKSTFLKRLNAGDRAGCARAIMSWTKPPEITSRRTAERDQFLTPYSVALPKARSNDRSAVKIGAAAPRTSAAAPRNTAQDSAAAPILAPPPAANAPAMITPTGKGFSLGGLIGSLFGRKSANPAAQVPAYANVKGDPTVFHVQTQLRARNYYVRGFVDGLDGTLTRDAVAAARKDNAMGDGGIDAAFLAALPAMPQRPVSLMRANVGIAQTAAHVPELAAPPSMLLKVGATLLGLGGVDAAKTSGVVDSVQSAADTAGSVLNSVQGAVTTLTGIVTFLVEHRTLVFIAVGAWAVLKGVAYFARLIGDVRAAIR